MPPSNHSHYDPCSQLIVLSAEVLVHMCIPVVLELNLTNTATMVHHSIIIIIIISA